MAFFKFLVVMAVACHGIRSQPYSIEPGSITVSGVSSGGAMATQLHVAYSNKVKGAGIFAGPPYYCSQSTVSISLGPCMDEPAQIDVSVLTSKAESLANAGVIDPVERIAGSNVFLFAGTLDSVVLSGVSDKVSEFYTYFGANIASERTIQAEHCQPTNIASHTQCDFKGENYINFCNYDGALNALEHFYGPLNPPTAVDDSLYQSFDQGDFTFHLLSAISMDRFGYAYVPTNCQDGTVACKLHVALHGCEQGAEFIQEDFYKNTGYSNVAEANDIIMIFPQTAKSFSNPVNGFGCWDWWAYTSPLGGQDEYVTKTAPQMELIMNIVSYYGG